MTLPFVKDGLGVDRAIAALFFHAKAGETVSLMSARAQRDGKRWGCLLCAFFDIAIQRGHCAETLAGDATPQPAMLRAGALLFGAVGAVAALIWLAGRLS